MYNMDLKILQILVIIILLNVFYCNNKVFAQFSMSAELRPRFECRNGYGRLPTINDNSAYFISQRSRINLHYKNSKVRYVKSKTMASCFENCCGYHSANIPDKYW